MSTGSSKHKRLVQIYILDSEQARFFLKYKIPLFSSVLRVRLIEGGQDHEAEYVYANSCTQQELAKIIEGQVQRILDEHDRAKEAGNA